VKCGRAWHGLLLLLLLLLLLSLWPLVISQHVG
jgi:hypothetical protein